MTEQQQQPSKQTGGFGPVFWGIIAIVGGALIVLGQFMDLDVAMPWITLALGVATWPVLYGLIIIFMSVSMASIEAIVVLLDEPGAPATLRRFMTRLALTMCSLPIVLNATPLAELWFTNISALPTALVHPAHMALWLALPIPALAAFEALFQGTLMHRRRTRGITEAVLLGLTLIGCVLMAGVLWGEIPGIYVGMGALSLAYVGRAGWLWQRSSRISAK